VLIPLLLAFSTFTYVRNTAEESQYKRYGSSLKDWAVKKQSVNMKRE